MGLSVLLMAVMETDVYTDELIDKLGLRWGEGFMSPGGPPALTELLHPLNIDGCRVLDFGCGVGGYTSLLVSAHGAHEVIGIDIDPHVLARAEQWVADKGTADRISFRRVDVGPLPFPDAAFDVVLSVGGVIHHSDKPRLFRDFARLLPPGGRLVISDWYASDAPYSEEMRHWAQDGDFIYDMISLKQAGELAQAAGFVGIEQRDRNSWFREQCRRDLQYLKSDIWETFVQRFGEAAADNSVHVAETFLLLADQGQLRPGYLYARAPGAEG